MDSHHYVVRTNKSAEWAVSQGARLGKRYVDVEIHGSKRRVASLLNALERNAYVLGAKVLRNSPGLDQRRVTIQYPRAGGSMPPPPPPPRAGVREPREPLPGGPPTALSADEPA